MPKMRHPKAKGSIEVGPAQVAMYESQGWEVQAPKKKTSAQTATNPATDATTKE